MPPPSHIEQYDPRFFRPCIFPVLRGLRYGVSPTINNGLPPDHPYSTDLDVSLSLFDREGRHLGTTEPFHQLAPGEIAKWDLDYLLAREEIRSALREDGVGGDQLGILHLVPPRWSGETAVKVESADMQAHVLASDDFIEYHQREGPVITGVAYQTGPKNDRRMSSTMSTVVQAPKVIVSEPVDTLFVLMNISTSFDYDNRVHMDFWILGPDGSRVARSAIEVPAWTYRLVSTTEVLEEAGALENFREHGGKGMFLGYSKDGTLVPLSFTRNKRTGALACDHTLPPPFYVTTWGGEARLAANARLEEEFFARPVEKAAVR